MPLFLSHFFFAFFLLSKEVNQNKQEGRQTKYVFVDAAWAPRIINKSIEPGLNPPL